VRFGLAALVVITAVGCGGASPEPRLTVFAAASLTEVLPRVDDRPRYSFTGSDELGVQIREGAPADVYATASPSHAAALHDEGLIEEPRLFATNRLVLIVPKENPADLGSVEDLERKPAKLVIGAEGVPVGEYARQALETLGAESVLARVVSEEQDVKGVASKVALGEADAGFAYATDVAPVAARVRVIELPARAQPQVEYVIAMVAGSKHAAEAEAFVDELLGPRGRRALGAAGFGVP
jgi:molybdate transport system substrate-binding protein